MARSTLPLNYVPLWCKSVYSFLEGASDPSELVEEAHRLGLPGLALTDRDGVYGAVRGFVRARELEKAQVPRVATAASTLHPTYLVHTVCRWLTQDA